MFLQILVYANLNEAQNLNANVSTNTISAPKIKYNYILKASKDIFTKV
ncbi:hypothetical protein ACFIJ5_17255 [Haloimpatiens sp. FM7330]